MPLLRPVLRLAFAPDARRPPEGVEASLAAASPRAWRRTLGDLDMHRLTPLVAWALSRAELDRLVPASARRHLEDAYRQTLLANTVHVQALARVLAELRACGIDGLLMKGLMLAGRYYPELGVRPMVDVDLLVDAADGDRTRRALEQLGHVKSGPWGNYSHAANGMTIDLHTAMSLFADRPRDEVAESWTSPWPEVGTITTWEPHATLVQLVTHLDKHSRETGISLLWVLDIVLLVRSLGPRLDVSRVAALAPSPASVDLTLDVLRLAQREFGAELPAALTDAVAARPGLSLPWLMRQRRLKRWGFPRWRSYLHYATRLLRLRELEGRQWLHWSDIPLGVLDAVVDRSRSR